MNIQSKLFAALNGISAVAGRVYPNVLPQAPVYPCLAYQFISNLPADSFIASARFTDFRAQITVHATDYSGLLALRQSVLTATEAMPEHVVRETDIESPFEFETKTFTWIFGLHLRDYEQ